MTEIKENLRFLQVLLRYPRNTVAELRFFMPIELTSRFVTNVKALT
jgi:hypothetical protein